MPVALSLTDLDGEVLSDIAEGGIESRPQGAFFVEREGERRGLIRTALPLFEHGEDGSSQIEVVKSTDICVCQIAQARVRFYCNDAIDVLELLDEAEGLVWGEADAICKHVWSCFVRVMSLKAQPKTTCLAG